MDKLKQMESFVAVALRGSLTAAAKAEGKGAAAAPQKSKLSEYEEHIFDLEFHETFCRCQSTMDLRCGETRSSMAAAAPSAQESASSRASRSQSPGARYC